MENKILVFQTITSSQLLQLRYSESLFLNISNYDIENKIITIFLTCSDIESEYLQDKVIGRIVGKITKDCSPALKVNGCSETLNTVWIEEFTLLEEPLTANEAYEFHMNNF